MEESPQPGLVLRIVSGPEAGRSLPLEAGRRIRIGRSPPPAETGAAAVDLVIDDRKLSRLHCEVHAAGGGWAIRDCGSSNGTFLNGERVVEAGILPGDLVQAGNVVLELADPAAPSPPREPARPRASAPLRRRPAARRRSPALAGAIGLAAAVGLAIAAAVVLRGRGREEPSPAVVAPAPARSSPTRIAAPPRAKAADPPAQVATTAAAPADPGDAPIVAVESFLDAGDYRRALAYLDDIADRDEGFDPGPLRKSVLDRAAADLAAAEKEAERRFRSGSAAAAEPLEEIALRIPDDLASDAALALERINVLREAAHDHERKVEASTSGVRAAIARLAFDEARRLLAGMEAARKGAAEAAAGAGIGAAQEAALANEIRLAERSWKLLEGAIGARIEARGVVRLAFAEPAEAGGLEAASYRILARDGDELTLEKAGARKGAASRSASLFSLDDPSLKALLGSPSSGDPDALEGLALLLLHRGGPARAAAFTGAERALEPARRERILRLADTGGDAWLNARRESIARAAVRLAGGGSRESWEDLSRRIGALVKAWRGRPGYARERAALLDLFVKVRIGALKLDGLRGIFSAARAELEGSRVKLVYDFSSDQELADFRKASGPDSAVERQDGLLVLRGECRLFAGEPFEKSLTVRGKLPAGGFDPSAPNLAVGLFVREKDRLRIEGQQPMSLFALLAATNGPEPSDHAVFAIGYRTVVADYGGKPLENLQVTGQQDPVPLPAHAILFGRRGRPLHTDARECVWAVKAAPIAGAVGFEATAATDRLQWKLNGRTLVDGGPPLERWAAESGRMGSVALLTRAAEVRLSSLEVEGDLRDAWLAERLKDEALRAFREIDPDA
jgi:hypothetical protein